MKRPSLIFVAAVFLLFRLNVAHAEQIPSNIIDSESNIHADLNGDGKDELVRSFRVNPSADSASQAITVIESEGKVVKKILGDERPESIEAKDLNQDKKNELIILTSGGNHYLSIAIYQYQNNDYVPIFKEGSASGVIFDGKSIPPLVKIGRGDWKREGGWDYASEPLQEVYKWTGDRFEYSKELSNTPLIGEKQDLKNAIDNVSQKSSLSKEETRVLAAWIAGVKAEDLLAT